MRRLTMSWKPKYLISEPLGKSSGRSTLNNELKIAVAPLTKT